jgi:membrane protease subunit HflK
VRLRDTLRQALDYAFGGRRWLLTLAALLVAEWCATGIRVVREDEQGVVLQFGAIARVAPAGILFTLPWPVERTVIVRTTEVRTMPIGYKLVDARRGIPPTTQEVEWVTGDTNLIDLTLAIKYSVGNAATYLMRVGPGDADFLVRRCAEACVTRLVATMPVDELLTRGKLVVQEETRRQTQAQLDSLEAGIRIVTVNIGEVQPPANVIQAFNDVATAKMEKAKLIDEADGYGRDLLPRARAQANRAIQEAESYRAETVARAQGDAAQFQSLLAEAQRARKITEVRLYLEAMERILPRARKLIVDPKDGTQLRLLD